MIDTPQIDSRTRQQVAAQVRALIPTYVPTWQATGAGDALVEIFARFVEVIIERLNRVPEKSFLAFLDMIGVNLLPPLAARVPVQFFLVDGARDDGLVPRGTPLATAGPEPRNFETENDLSVTRTRLVRVATLDPRSDQYTAHADAAVTFQPFVGTTLIDHIVYLAQDTLFHIAHPTHLWLRFDLGAMTSEQIAAVNTIFASISWWTRRDGKPVALAKPSVAVNPNGRPLEVELREVAGIEQWEAGGILARWLWAKTEEPLTSRQTDLLPLAQAVSARTELANPISPDLAFANHEPVDLAKGGFFPFGERPRTNDTFSIASREVFSKRNARVTLEVTLRFPITPSPDRAPIVTLAWEFWNGDAWRVLGTTTHAGGTSGVTDSSRAFTASGPQTISFMCPEVVANEVNGQGNYWIRARITEGNFGEDARLTVKQGVSAPQSLADWIYAAPTFRPPMIASLNLSYSYDSFQDISYVLTSNKFVYEVEKRPGTPLEPFLLFQLPEDEDSGLYLGFESQFSNQAVSLYLPVVEQDEVPSGSVVTWEYWNGTGSRRIPPQPDWKSLGVQDDTKNLTQPGMVEFIGPVDFNEHTEFGSSLHWLRARLVHGQKSSFKLSAIYPNTVWAHNAVTIAGELLGASTGKPNQVVRLSRAPVLSGQQIEVRELEPPTPEDISTLEQEGEKNPVRVVHDEAQRTTEIWVRWHEVQDFQLSAAASRHYAIDRATGQIHFGDGQRGMIPPPGRNNIRAARYQAGGGRSGNVAAGSLTVLKRAIPLIDRVTNPVAASGGSDQEGLHAVKRRGPQTIKQRGRAVAAEDYEWLARGASIQVAMARCVPARDAATAGHVQVLIVPDNDEPEPFPSPGLLRRVKAHLDARRPPTTDLAVIGPVYVNVSVTADVVPLSFGEADLVRRRIVQRLAVFLHPLKGGPEEGGWVFGRDVYLSEIAALIEATEGVDHLKETTLSGRTGSQDRTHDNGTRVEIRAEHGELVASGDHTISMSAS